MTQSTRHPTLDHLARLVGEWDIEATHPMLPGVVIPGHATFEWLHGGQFLVWRAHHDHPDIPDSIAIMGRDDAGDAATAAAPGGPCVIHYFDSRGVARVYQLAAEPGEWRFWRDEPGFSQRFTGTFSDDGDTITGHGELSEDDKTWKPDLQTKYSRVV